jgi:hypothetical protein
MDEIKQGSPEWFALRWGRLTGTDFKKVNGTPAAQRKLAMQKRYELANPVEVPEQLQAKPVLWGKQNEPRAIAQYEMTHGDLVFPAFVVHPEYDFIGFSPDGVGVDRGVECKCPWNTDIHRSTWSLGMPAEHTPQVQGGMWVLGFDLFDFLSFDPRVALPKDLYVQPIRRDDQYIDRLERNCLRVWDMVMSDKALDVDLDEIPQLF